MKRGKNPKFSITHSTVDFYIAVLGNTTSNPTVPANGDFRPGASTYPAKANQVSLASGEGPTRSSQGIFVITYAHNLPNVLMADAVVVKAGSSPTALLCADVTIIDTVNRQITVKVSTSAGTLTDPGVNDLIIIKCEALDTTA